MSPSTIQNALGAILTAAVLATGCPSSPSAPRLPEGESGKTTAPQASIGSATMERDGTLVLMLRAEGPGGIRGDALFRYPPSHPRYQEMLRHLGAIRPGESKPVPPFPEKR